MELQRRRDGRHKHQELMGKRAQWAAKYPDELCRAICRRLMTETRNETMKVKMFLSIKSGDVIQEFDDAKTEGRCHEEGQEAWDDVTGERLDRGEVLKARAIEIQYIIITRVWSKIKRSEAQSRGSKITKTRWLDINK